MTLPTAPEGVSIQQNMQAIRQRFGKIRGALDYYWFYQQVRNKGPWDFKQKNRKFEDFGNFHYGAVGYAGGIPETLLLRAAGCAQQRAATSEAIWGNCWSNMPYGDDPNDQLWIQRGIEYAKNHGY